MKIEDVYGDVLRLSIKKSVSELPISKDFFRLAKKMKVYGAIPPATNSPPSPIPNSPTSNEDNLHISVETEITSDVIDTPTPLGTTSAHRGNMYEDLVCTSSCFVKKTNDTPSAENTDLILSSSRNSTYRLSESLFREMEPNNPSITSIPSHTESNSADFAQKDSEILVRKEAMFNFLLLMAEFFQPEKINVHNPKEKAVSETVEPSSPPAQANKMGIEIENAESIGRSDKVPKTLPEGAEKIVDDKLPKNLLEDEKINEKKEDILVESAKKEDILVESEKKEQDDVEKKEKNPEETKKDESNATPSGNEEQKEQISEIPMEKKKEQDENQIPDTSVPQIQDSEVKTEEKQEIPTEAKKPEEMNVQKPEEIPSVPQNLPEITPKPAEIEEETAKQRPQFSNTQNSSLFQTPRMDDIPTDLETSAIATSDLNTPEIRPSEIIQNSITEDKPSEILQIPIKTGKFLERDEFFQNVDINLPDTMSKYLVDVFGENGPVTNLLKTCHQTIIARVLHRVRDTLSNCRTGLQFKDVRGSWEIKVHFKKDHNGKFEFVSTTHRRKEQFYWKNSLIVGQEELITQMVWELTSYYGPEIKEIAGVEMNLIGFAEVNSKLDAISMKKVQDVIVQTFYNSARPNRDDCYDDSIKPILEEENSNKIPTRSQVVPNDAVKKSFCGCF